MKKVAVGLIGMLILGLLLPDAHADQFEIRPYLAVRGEYNDNIFFNPDSNDAEDDYILTIKPGLEITDRTERLSARLRGQIAPFFYKDNSDLDEVDQDYRGRISYRFTPRFSGEADAFYIVTHRPNRDLLTTGLVQNVNRRDGYHIGGGLEYDLSEVTTADFSYDFNRDDWERDANLEDVDYNTVNLGLSHDLERWLRATTGQLTFEYGNIDRDSSETDSFAGLVAIRYSLSELFRLRLRGGARYVSSDFQVTETEGRESNTGWGAIGAAILEYNGERTRSDLLFSHDLSPGVGRGTPTVLTRAVGTVDYRILEDLRIGLSGGIYRNKADSGDFGIEEIDQYTFQIRPDIRWEFYDNFTLTAAYIYTYLDNRVTDSNSTRNAVFLEVSYGLPLFDFFDLTGSEVRQIVSGAVPVPESR
jgi:hypothetical protein